MGNCHTERVLFNESKKRFLAREIFAFIALAAKLRSAVISAGEEASDWRRNPHNFSVSWLA